MSRQQKVQNRGYAKAFADQLTQRLARDGFEELPDVEDGYDEINVVETYGERGIPGRDGLVLEMASGAEVWLAIQAYTPAGAR